jgi:hypothetical protein
MNNFDSAPDIQHFDDMPRIELPFSDEALSHMVCDASDSRALHASDPITWLRGAIGVDQGRGASEITDDVLHIGYQNGGRFEWDPSLSKIVAKHLRTRGYPVFVED